MQHPARPRDAEVAQLLEEERQRFVRDLHDGAQQSLVVLGTRIALAQALAHDSEELSELLRAARSDLSRAMEEIRAAASGGGPGLLAGMGLRASLRARARHASLPIDVSCPDGRYPARIETCVYFCCAEAMQNVVKHAGASRGSVRVVLAGPGLRFEVRDDGRGFDPGQRAHGRGLRNIRERVEALGGSQLVSSAPGAGTTVAGWVPVDGGSGMPIRDGHLSRIWSGTGPVD
jgi:signal transduction histidine kinase